MDALPVTKGKLCPLPKWVLRSGVLALPFKNIVPHSPIYRGLCRARLLGVALLKLLWTMWDAQNIVRPTPDTNLSRLESSVAHINYMCGRWAQRGHISVFFQTIHSTTQESNADNSCCNTHGVGWLDKSSSIRYSAWVVIEKVYEWPGFALDDSHRP
jgi:hypothetical protein